MMKIYSTYVKKKKKNEDIYLTETELQLSGVAAVNNWFRSLEALATLLSGHSKEIIALS